MNTIRLNVLGEAKAASSGVSIKNQDKSVDITENGVTEVTADSGYTGLGKVTINANVQGGSSGGGEDTMEYLDVSGLDDTKKQMLVMMCAIARAGVSIVPPLVLIGEGISLSDITSYTSMCGIDFETPIHYSSTDFSIKELLMASAFTETELNAIPRITKEQFYTI